jgi:hypothetical protein
MQKDSRPTLGLFARNLVDGRGRSARQHDSKAFLFAGTEPAFTGSLVGSIHYSKRLRADL